MGELLTSALTSVDATQVTNFFLGTVVIIFGGALIAARLGKARRFVAYTPNLLTSIGILGTFIGIVIGLDGFNNGDVQESIEKLLGGLRTAFVTSLVGIAASIVFRAVSATPIFTRATTASTSQSIGPALIAAAQSQTATLEALKEAVAGDEESSLAAQIKLFRSDARDRAEEERRLLGAQRDALEKILAKIVTQQDDFSQFTAKLWVQMSDFANMLSKSATEQVINALKDVIADFNKNLTEQFGENFKALDVSVQRLVEWQENYRHQLAQMTDQYELGVSAIAKTEASVAHISEESKQIPETMGALRSVLEVNQHQIGELDRHLESFSDIRDRAVEAVPEIRHQVKSTVDDVQAAAQAASEHYRTLLTQSQDHSNEHDRVSRDILESYTTSAQDGERALRDALEGVSRELVESISTGAARTRTAIITGAEEFDANVQRVNANLTNTSDMLAEKTVAIRDELQDVVSDMSNQNQKMIQKMIEGTKTIEDDTRSIAATLRDAGEQVIRDSQSIQEQVASSTTEMQRRLEGALEEVFQAQVREASNMLDRLAKSLEAATERTGDNVNQQMQLIDESMQREVDRVMERMGTALVRITNQFASDYSQLVDAMAQVTRQGASA